MGGLAAVLTAAGVTIYTLGLIGLAIPVRRRFTADDLWTASCAVSLMPKTVVAEQGARIWLKWPTRRAAGGGGLDEGDYVLDSACLPGPPVESERLRRDNPCIHQRLICDEDGALIVACGDFNADLHDVPVQAIRGDVESTGNGELAWQVMVPCENSVPESAQDSLQYLGQGEMIGTLPGWGTAPSRNVAGVRVLVLDALLRSMQC
jgi:hypothetical protein